MIETRAKAIVAKRRELNTWNLGGLVTKEATNIFEYVNRNWRRSK